MLEQFWAFCLLIKCMSAISWHEILLHGLKITAGLAFCHVTIRAATRRACLPCTGAGDGQQTARESRTVVSLLKVQESSLEVCVPWIHHLYLFPVPPL